MIFQFSARTGCLYHAALPAGLPVLVFQVHHFMLSLFLLLTCLGPLCCSFCLTVKRQQPERFLGRAGLDFCWHCAGRSLLLVCPLGREMDRPAAGDLTVTTDRSSPWLWPLYLRLTGLLEKAGLMKDSAADLLPPVRSCLKCCFPCFRVQPPAAYLMLG